MASQEEVKALLNDSNRLRNLAKGAFDAVDSDRSGFIDETELFSIMAKVSKTINAPPPTKQQVNAILAETDTNSDGKVGFDEYLALVRKTLERMLNKDARPSEESKTVASNEEIRALLSDQPRLRKLAKGTFDAVDTDGSSVIDEAELFAVMTKMAKSVNAPPPTKQQVKATLGEIDVSRDGKVSFDEYIALVRKTLAKMIGQEEERKSENRVHDEIRALLNDQPRLQKLVKASFDSVDADRSGAIDETELFTVMTKMAKSVNAPPPTKQQVKATLGEIDVSRDGKVSLDEYLALVRKTLMKIIGQEEERKVSSNPEHDEIRALLRDLPRFRKLTKDVFDSVDVDRSGAIDESELTTVMTNIANSMGVPPPTRKEVKDTLAQIDLSRDGKISLDELMTVVRRELLKIIGEPDTSQAGLRDEPRSMEQERLRKQVQMFEKYLEDSGMTMAFQIIFAEIITKKIEPANVFTYTAMRLRQIGKEIAHLLPKNLTAGISEGS
jgi:Ca2+-binding EF-hand superfamily protein